VTREYRKAARADAEAATRQRILGAAIATVAQTQRFGVRDIARAAGVTVQTVYAHFGSKSGLIMAVVAEVSARRGLGRGLARVWRHTDPEDALAEMVTATFEFWHRAWRFIEFSLIASRTDPDYAAQVGALDEARLADLVRICERLDGAGRLRDGLTPGTAAALAFTWTAPAVYEELVARGRIPMRSAVRVVRTAVLQTLVQPARV
jgi:AcrR family transcriptional regulator